MTDKFAIIGMAGNFPGAPNIEQYWKNLCAGVESITHFTDEELKKSGVLEEYLQNPNYVKANAILEDADFFDPSFFGIGVKDASFMDPQLRLFLECSYLALENAGYFHQDVGEKTGVFAGTRISEYLLYNLPIPDNYGNDISPNFFKHVAINDKDNFALSVAYYLNLQGPAIAVQTACSTSLTALHLACQSIFHGECELAIVGGAAVKVPLKTGYMYHEGMMLSKDGHVRVFDENATGTIFGSGVGAVVVKKLEKAITDHDNIYAVVTGTAVNNDGSEKASYFSPSKKGQKQVIKSALKKSSAEVEDFLYIEAHGTATVAGDPIEFTTLTDTFKEYTAKKQFCAIGSVKANITHVAHAAGVAGLIKVAFMAKHRKLVPQINFSKSNPLIDFENSPFYVNTEFVDWPQNKKYFMGVSSFGIGGTNAHVVVEEAPSPSVSLSKQYYILNLSTKTAESFQQQKQQYIKYLNNTKENLTDICFTSSVSRGKFDYRASLIASNKEEFIEKLENLETYSCAKEENKIAFMFTGQGSQYYKMGIELYNTCSFFRDQVNECDRLFFPYLNTSIIKIIHSEDEATGILHETLFTQSAIFTIQFSLAKLWEYWGVTPDIIIGHSLGEYAAAAFCDILTLENAVFIVATRGKLMQDLPKVGSMYAIFTDAANVASAIAEYPDDVSIAAHNDPSNIVISGKTDIVETIVANFEKRGISSRQLLVSHAFHSPLMKPIIESFRSKIKDTPHNIPKYTFVSTATGKVENNMEAEYWCLETMSSVQFIMGIDTVAKLDANIFLEIGPHPTLTAIAKNIVSSDKVTWSYSLHKKNDNWLQLLQSLQSLYLKGLNINWENVMVDSMPNRIAMPCYSFNKQRCWVDHSVTKKMQQQNHPLLGNRLYLPSSGIQFQSTISSQEPEYLQNHLVYEQVIFPATGYIEIIWAAMKEIFPNQNFKILEIIVKTPFDIDGKYYLNSTITKIRNSAWKIQIFSQNTETKKNWKLHVESTIIENAEFTYQIDLNDEKKQCSNEVCSKELYKRKFTKGLNQKNEFQCVERIFIGKDKLLAKIECSENLSLTNYILHPVLLDACLHATEIFMEERQDKVFAYLPMLFENIQVFAPLEKEMWSFIKLISFKEEMISVEVEILNSSGQVLAKLGRVHSRYNKNVNHQFSDWLYTKTWEECPSSISKTNQAHEWLIFGDNSIFCQKLIEKLKETTICREVYEGKYYKEDNGKYQIKSDSTEDYQKLFSSLTDRFRILYLWGLDNKIVHGHNPVRSQDLKRMENLLYLWQSAMKQSELDGLYCVTNGVESISNLDSVAPLQAPLSALVRTFSQESTHFCKNIDLDPCAIEQNLNFLITELRDSTQKNIAFRFDKRYVPVLKRYPDPYLAKEQKCLTITAKGNLSNLQNQSAKREISKEQQVEIEIYATGLNFKDVLNALGKYPGNAGRLGKECSGVVVSKGSNVTHINVGDAVVAMADGSFANYVTVDSSLVVKIPQQMSFEQAASIPIVYLTAYYGLCHCAKLSKNQKILIHSGAGGVGFAAIQIAKWLGAEIFVTASKPKWDFLQFLGIDNILDSRDVSFADDIMVKTNGQGVDVVLNSLAGEFLDKSFTVLKESGVFIEIGKVGIWSQEQVASLNKNIAYFPFELGEIYHNAPDFFQSMFQEVMLEITKGNLKLPLLTIFRGNDHENYFRYMAQAKHIGKIVVSKRNISQYVPLKKLGKTYLITGGLTGLGLLFAKHLAKEGCKNLILIGRRKPSPEALETIAYIKEQGCHVYVEQVDISCFESTKNLFEKIQQSMPPLNGVIHSAGLLAEGAIQNLTWSEFLKVFAPKIAGTWNLHFHTQHLQLESFVLFSSVSAFWGTKGQANYAMANAFMDAFADYRRNLFLPAISVNWSSWSEIGMAASQNKRFRKLREDKGVFEIDPSLGTALFDKILQENYPRVIAMKMDWQKFKQNAYDQNFTSHLCDTMPQPVKQKRDNNDALEQLSQVPDSQKKDVLIQHILQKIQKVSGYLPILPQDINTTVTHLGVDSLSAIEMRNELETSLKIKLSPTVLFDFPTIHKLTEYIHSIIFDEQKIQAEEKHNASWQQIDDLSAEEVEKMLEEELNNE